MLKCELGVWVPQDVSRGWTHVIEGSFADPQFDTQAVPDHFCYDRLTRIGAFFVTTPQGSFDYETTVPDGFQQVGGNHIFVRRWTHIVYIPVLATVLPAPHINRLLLFYEAPSGLAEVYETADCGNLILKKQYCGWRTSWMHMIAGQFGKANLLFYDMANDIGEFYAIDNSGDLQFIEGWS